VTDAHCHLTGGDPTVREWLIGRDFVGVHPWEANEIDLATELAKIRTQLIAEPQVGVGEIGLDRLKDREISAKMREVFEAQLWLAAEFARPVVLHGAKCWGQVVAAAAKVADQVPAFLFHGFSRSDGLIPDIVKLGGSMSVGPAVLNDHALNYRALVKKVPLERLLIETDRTEANAEKCPPLADIYAKVAELRGMTIADLEQAVDANFLRLHL